MFHVFSRIPCFLCVCVVNIASVSAIKYSTAEYKCDKGVYQDLFDLALAVRYSAYSPFLAQLRKKQSFVSGQDILDHMQHYCAMAQDIIDSQKYMMKHIKCLKTEVKTFEAMIRKSHSYCLKTDGRSKTPYWSFQENFNTTTARPGPGVGQQEVKNVAPTGLMEGVGAVSSRTHRAQADPDQNRIEPRLLNIFKKLPLVHLDYRTNPCYYQAPKSVYSCYRRNTMRPRKKTSALALRLKRKASSMRCTFRSLARMCPRKQAFLITVMEYDWMVVPPPLDVNIGYFLLRAWRTKL